MPAGAVAAAARPTPLHLRRSRRLGILCEGACASMTTLLDRTRGSDVAGLPVLVEQARPAGSGAHFVTDGCLLSRSLWDFRHSLVIDMHGATGLRDGRACDGTSALRPFLQDAQDLLGL